MDKLNRRSELRRRDTRDEEVRGWAQDHDELEESVNRSALLRPAPLPKRNLRQLNPCNVRSGSVPLLGIGFAARDSPLTRTEPSDVETHAQSTLSSTLPSVLSSKSLVRELHPAKAVTLEIDCELYPIRRFQTRIVRKKLVERRARASPDNFDSLEASTGELSSPQQIEESVILQERPPLAKVYFSEKTAVKRELVSPPHATDLTYSLALSNSTPPKLPALKPRKAQRRVRRPEVNLQLPAEMAKLSVLRSTVDAANLKHTVPYVELINSDFPKYRIAVDYHLYRNVRKYAPRRSVVSFKQPAD